MIDDLALLDEIGNNEIADLLTFFASSWSFISSDDTLRFEICVVPRPAIVSKLILVREYRTS